MRRGLAAVALAVVVAAPGQAAADAVYPVPADDVATCARDLSGGRMTLQAHIARRTTPTDVLDASPDQIQRAAGVDLGNLITCPEAASGGGVTAVGGAARTREGVEIRAAARTDTGAFAAPVTLGKLTDYPEAPVAVAVGPRGDAVVAWLETTGDPTADIGTVRILAARRPAAPGAEFGPAEEVLPRRRQREFEFGENRVAAGVDRDGRTTVAWAVGVPPRGRVSHLSAIGTATAASGEPLKPVTAPGSLQDVGPLSLAVAPDGSALLTVTGQEQVHVFERRGAGAFAEGEPLGAEGQSAEEADVALDPSGAAVIAWRYQDYANEDTRPRTGINVARRAAGGAFGAPASLGSRTIGDDGSFFAIAIAADGVSPPLDVARVRAAITADGSAAVTWSAPRRVGGDDSPAGYFARAAADGGFTVARLANPCRPVNGVVPLRSGTGLVAAWTDNAADRLDDELEYPRGSGRLHVTDPSAPRAAIAAAPPRLSVRPVRGIQRLWSADAIKVPVACDGPCDLRAFVPGGARPVIASGTSLTARGRTTVELYPYLTPIGLKVKTLHVVVHGCSPDGTSMSTATTSVRAVRNRAPRIPPPVNVKARRSGDAIIVSWRTPFPARRTAFGVYAHAHRRLDSAPAAEASVEGRARTRFRARLTPTRGARVGYVTVSAFSTEYSRQQHAATVPVRP